MEGVYVLTKSSNPSRVPLNSAQMSVGEEEVEGSAGMRRTFVAFHDDPDGRSDTPVDQLEGKKLRRHC